MPLQLRDVRRMFRLIGEIRELSADPNRWRPHMLERLRRQFNASMIISTEMHFRTTSTPGVLRVIDHGWGINADGHVWQIQSETEDERPESYRLVIDQMAEARDPGSVVPVKPQQATYGGTGFVVSQCTLPHVGAVDQLALHRQFGQANFSADEHRLARLFHVELARLWRQEALKRASNPAADLPPRLAQTLAELLDGASEKQIAQKLNLSPHTVHNYVKALHQRFEVSSRGELLAKVGAARQDFIPKLSVRANQRDLPGDRKK